ncbi:hypothetical protein QEN19_004241 [Hanseniaspora menglaensis]
MPPKKQNEAKKKSSVDKTFGMKNKKGSKAKKQIEQINRQNFDFKKDEMRRQKEEAKFLKEQEELTKKLLFNPVIKQPVVAKGVDPKTVLCPMFKLSNCNKGSNCKFSHDANLVANFIQQQNEARQEEEKLKQKEKPKMLNHKGNEITSTDIICKFMIEMMEKQLWGFRLEEKHMEETDCKYVHQLPEGYIVKTAEQKRLEREMQENMPKITIEQFVEQERESLDKDNLTPLTLDLFKEINLKHKLLRMKIKENKGVEGTKSNNKVKKSGRELVQEKMNQNKSWIEEVDSNDTGNEFDIKMYRQRQQAEDDNQKKLEEEEQQQQAEEVAI